MKLKYILLIALIVICSPVLVNWILNINTPLNIAIVGTGKDWISFYGSFIGAIVASFTSFVILYKTIQHNQNEARIMRQIQKIENIEHRLERVNAIITFGLIGNGALIHNENSLISLEILKLESLRDSLTRERNSIQLSFGRNQSSYVISYIEKLDKCIEQLFIDITEMIKILTELKGNKEIELRTDILTKLHTQIIALGFHSDTFSKPVYESAVHWIEMEQEILKKLTK